MPAKSAGELKIREYSVSWKGTTVGWVKGVDLSNLKPKFVEKKIEEVGDVVIDEVLAAYEGTVMTVLKQVKLATLRQLLLNAPGSGSIPGWGTAQYASNYAAAGLLKLHPTDMGSDETEDSNILKAVPILKLPKSSEGKEYQTFDVEWKVYPDQTQLFAEPPVLLYFYVGAVPA